MQVTVLLIDGEFLAFDKDGAMITDRSILEQMSFEPAEGTYNVEDIQVDNDIDSAIITPLSININYTQR